MARTDRPRAGWDCAGLGLGWNRLRLWLKQTVVGRERKLVSGLAFDLTRCAVGEETGRVEGREDVAIASVLALPGYAARDARQGI